MGQHQLYIRFLQVSRQHRHSWIATCHQQPVAKLLRILKNLNAALR
jgi:hypothetical protein